MRASLASVDKDRQEPLAVEVRSHGTGGKRLIPPPAALIVTPPIDIGVFAGGEDGLDDAGFGIKGTTNSVNLTVAFLGIIDIIGIELLADFLKAIGDVIAAVGGPILEDPFEVRANFSGHVVGTIRGNILQIGFKRDFDVVHKRLHRGIIKVVSIQLTHA
ncbi:uncharacterized protein BcabD6B2_44490 [Babesia caballi]|uniref:Uncharacterized protein n=1 Tax=Babesia caballi TaxID=5871 RepID=A0AAV4LZ23_BABCB|nr:hypothetical protein BcabD6B2_44490 [Babesia caballi]